MVPIRTPKVNQILEYLVVLDMVSALLALWDRKKLSQRAFFLILACVSLMDWVVVFHTWRTLNRRFLEVRV